MRSGRQDEERRHATRGTSFVINSLRENPRDSINWHRYRSGCPHYRVRWFPRNDLAAGEPLYQVFCLMNTPPTSWDEQEKCIASRTECWRIAEARAAAKGGTRGGTRKAGASDIPLESVKRRKPA
jgi:hypothetical protein